jgi:hypothetical protein
MSVLIRQERCYSDSSGGQMRIQSAVKAEFRNLMDKDVPSFNRAASLKGITPLATVTPSASPESVNGRNP